jgi:dTDP-4-dehydrorhamnose reductase
LDFDGKPSDQSGATSRPVVVFGAAGQLGEVMAATLRARVPTVAATRDDVDLAQPVAIRQYVRQVQPRAIINCAGYNNVDGAEDDPATALAANAFAVQALARAARDVGATLVHYSSDFIFDGETDQPYREDSRPNPRSVYAASKLLGEWFAADAGDYYVLRVESLFGGITRRKSSLDQIIEKLAAGAPVKVFTDRVVSPSYVWDVADATAAILDARPPSGIYHCVNSGHATWYAVAEAAARELGVSATLEPITLAEVKLRWPTINCAWRGSASPPGRMPSPVPCTHGERL